MIRFTEAVKQYSEEKKARGLTSVVTGKELAKIRQLYKEGKFEESDNAAEDKKPEDGEQMNEAQKAEYDKTIAELRAYKESKGLGRGLSTKQKKMVERTILCGTLTKPTVIEENEKTIIAGPSTKVEEGKEGKDAIIGSIREARKNVFKAKRLLKENDMMGAADATQAAGDAVNAADAAMAAPAAEGAVPQNIVDAVASIKTTVDDLATQCGIQSPVDPAADPNAGVPAVDGAMQDPNAGMADPNAAAPVMESTKLSDAKARLAKREAMLKAVKEGANGQDAITQAIASMTNPQQFHDIDKKDSEELVKPTTQKSKDAANTWPTVKGTYKESVTEKMISDRIEESANAWDFNRILREGILG